MINVGIAEQDMVGVAAGLANGGRIAFVSIRTFAEDWHELILLAERHRLDVLLAPAAEVARAHPHLAETVLAFAA